MSDLDDELDGLTLFVALACIVVWIAFVHLKVNALEDRVDALQPTATESNP